MLLLFLGLLWLFPAEQVVVKSSHFVKSERRVVRHLQLQELHQQLGERVVLQLASQHVEDDAVSLEEEVLEELALLLGEEGLKDLVEVPTENGQQLILLV